MEGFDTMSINSEDIKKGAKINIIIDKILFPHLGVTNIGEKEIRVKNVLPGQIVKVLIKKKKKDYYQARLLEVVEKSPMEDEAKCDHYEDCGGCNRQMIEYNKQLSIKYDQVKELFQKNGFMKINFQGIIASPRIFEYRNKVEFSFGDLEKNGILQLGMHPRGRRFDVVTVNTCQLVDNDFRLILTTIIDYFRKLDFKRYHIISREGYLRNLVIRKGLKTDEISVNLITTSQQEHDLSDLSSQLTELQLEGNLVGFLQTINDDYGDDVKCDKLITHYGRSYYYEKLLDLTFKVTPFAFFQPNTFAAEELYKTVQSYIDEEKDNVIFDLYCGTGTISQVLAQKAKKVYGIELIKEAVEIARENAKINKISDCEFITGDVLEKVNKIKENPDLIVIDPPRPGINPKALQKIIDFNSKKIIYVSCNPKSLVDDLVDLIKANYKIREVKCVDMFPHTHHVETVVSLVKD